ncbi:MAG: aromatic amino acid transaminase [Pseudomonadota bacterium]
MAIENKTETPGGHLSMLTALPPDPLLGLMAAFRADERVHKLDLGVGVYRDENGDTPIMTAVEKAEQKLLSLVSTKAYEGPRGNAEFCQVVCQKILGEDALTKTRRETLDAFATPGGCGALGLGVGFLKRLRPNAKVWVSNPSWPNHQKIVDVAGLTPAKYTYHRNENNDVDFEQLEHDLVASTAGDAVIIQGPCHNPTGLDLSVAQWKSLAKVIKDKNLFPFIDIAYQGFGAGLDEDMLGIRAFLDEVDEALVSYSCSKNFGLYRDRCGCLILQAATQEVRDAAGTHIADIARATYSMPPAHGPAIVATILADKDLTTEWLEELTMMRERMITLRSQFARELEKCGKPKTAATIRSEKGMFSLLPIKEGAAARLRRDHGIYLPASGRINIAGMTEEKISEAASVLASEVDE